MTHTARNAMISSEKIRMLSSSNECTGCDERSDRWDSPKARMASDNASFDLNERCEEPFF